jgi:hypothetical protein
MKQTGVTLARGRRLAIRVVGAVHLGDGARGHRNAVDGLEYILPGHSQLLFHHPDDLFLDAAEMRRHGDGWKTVSVSVVEEGLEECTSPE